MLSASLNKTFHSLSPFKKNLIITSLLVPCSVDNLNHLKSNFKDLTGSIWSPLVDFVETHTAQRKTRKNSSVLFCTQSIPRCVAENRMEELNKYWDE